MGVLFSTGRLPLILIEYLDFGSGVWEQIVKETIKKYGSALDDSRTIVWNDGTTLLTLQHESSGNITVTLEDFAALSKSSDRSGLRCQNFEFAASHPHARNSRYSRLYQTQSSNAGASNAKHSDSTQAYGDGSDLYYLRLLTRTKSIPDSPRVCPSRRSGRRRDRRDGTCHADRL
jgi:hypothetical protein